MEATGWQAHTVRGTLAGSLKKRGYHTISDKAQGCERVYKISRTMAIPNALKLAEAVETANAG